MNPLYNELNRGVPQGAAGLIEQFGKFKQSFKGDPKAQVMQLVQTGQISQSELNSLQRTATMLQSILK